ncbi:Sbal_3080 family lipoprotein [Acinetobacter sp. NIPH 1852]|uniref:Sbal_3080 family lipoprotein n=1 Tax=Acinetobacter sp. NIPH 1852 TaxID=2923428 RepID=UPI001F4B6EAE|nr:Sbal_3080 family lipoprotein [Acinetobacter sp. NIPH 1852]MCH7307452.1 Sbal_3080 family lipoprotein [Acinetobacter sp. NIPH 1852]
MVKSICIENNPKVKIDRFQETLINRIESYHIQTQVFNAPFKPNICEFTLNYDATEDYETVFFISDMTLKLYNRAGQRIGLSEYHIYRGGGLDLTKYQGNDVKINQVVDGLLNSGKK